MDEMLLKKAQLRANQDIANGKKDAQVKNGLPRPRTITEVSAERRVEKELEAIAPKTGYPDLDQIIKGFIPGHLYTLTGNENVGKCEGVDTPHLMYDGSIKMVQDLKVGELLMGPDNKPRKILSTITGEDEMYSVQQDWGLDYTVNKSHILSLKWRNMPWLKKKIWKEYEPNKIENISIEEYLKKSNLWKRHCSGWHVPVDFPEQDLLIDPYILGLWLGDGSTNKPIFWSADDEVISILNDYAKTISLSAKIIPEKNSKAKRIEVTGDKGGIHDGSSLKERLRTIGVLGNKQIPDVYRVNSKENRLQLLAGIIDTDGWIQKNISKNTKKECYSYAISITNKRLADDILLLSCSLGFNARIRLKIARMKRLDNTIYETPCYTVSIQGDLTTIPVRVERKKITSLRIKSIGFSALKVVPRGIAKYYGFTLDGDGLYLLSDCTVTHNTSLACNFAVRVAKQGKKVLYFALEPENMVVDYIASVRFDKRFEDLLPEEVEYDDGNIHIFGKEQISQIDDLIKTIEYSDRYDLVIVDHIGYFVTGGNQNINQEQANAIKKLVGVAKKKQTSIIIIAHLRKPPQNAKKNYTPTSNDISGSAAFKQDSTEVMIVVRNVANPDDGGLQYTDSGSLFVTKTKAGPNGFITLNFSERKANISSRGEARAKIREESVKTGYKLENDNDKW